MKKINTVTLHIFGLMMTAELVFLATNVQADNTGSIGSAVTIVCPIIVTNGGPLDFGILSAPTNNEVDVWVLPSIAGDMYHEGLGDGISFGTPSKGYFDINGGQPALITVGVTDFPDLYLELDAEFINMAVGGIPLHNYYTNTFVLPLDDSNCGTAVRVTIGGRLLVYKGAAATNHTATINIIVNYY